MARCSRPWLALGYAFWVTGDRALYAQRRGQLQALHIGVVLVRDPARAGDRIEELARAIDRVKDGELIEVGAGDAAGRP